VSVAYKFDGPGAARCELVRGWPLVCRWRTSSTAGLTRQRLRPQEAARRSAAHRRFRWELLPSGPDPIHGLRSHRTRPPP